MVKLTAVGDLVEGFEAVGEYGYPGRSRTLHWTVRCVRCRSQYHVQGGLFRAGRLACDLCDYTRFTACELTTEEDLVMKNTKEIREYKKWVDMKNRCKNRTRYRGVEVAECWQSDFVQFFRDTGPQPGPVFVLDRYPDGAGHYQPGNVRWATPRQSNENRLWAKKEPARTV